MVWDFVGGLGRQCEFECGVGSGVRGSVSLSARAEGAAELPASPQPLSMAFFIRDFEGHGEGRIRSALPTGRRRRLAVCRSNVCLWRKGDFQGPAAEATGNSSSGGFEIGLVLKFIS